MRRRKSHNQRSVRESGGQWNHKHGEHKAGMSVASGGWRENKVKHKPGEKMRTWRAMPTTASYNIMCSKRYGTLLADSPYFDPDKIQKLMEKKVEEQLKMARTNGVIDQAVAAKALAKAKEDKRKERLRRAAERQSLLATSSKRGEPGVRVSQVSWRSRSLTAGERQVGVSIK